MLAWQASLRQVIPQHFRLAAGLRTQDAARALECGQPKISQIENGRRGIRPLDLTVRCRLYGVEDEQYRANLRRLAKEIHKVDWWSGQEPVLHDSLRDFLTLEADAQLVRTYESMVLPGLLQTEAYMRQTIANAGTDRTDTLVETLVETRQRRKHVLEDTYAFRLRAVIDVTALHRIAGPPPVVREQLEHLLHMTGRPNVHLQVLPLDAVLPQEQCPPFALLTMRGEPPADVVWLAHITGGTLLEQRQDVPRYNRLWDELTAAALPPAASQRYISELAEERSP